MSNKRVARVRPTADELREQSKHIAYEVEMLIGTATKLLGERTKDLVDLRAQAESFLIHVRALFQFFYRKPPDEIPPLEYMAPPIFAADYVDNWASMCPEDPEKVLETLSRDISRLVMHITVERVVGQQYPVLAAARALLEVIRTFRDAKAPDFVADLGDLEPFWAPRPGFVISASTTFSTSDPTPAGMGVVVDAVAATATATAIPPTSVGDGKD